MEYVQCERHIITMLSHLLSPSILCNRYYGLSYRCENRLIVVKQLSRHTALMELEFALLQGIFLTQGLNQGLLNCRWILYCLGHEGSLYLTYLLLYED